MDDNLYEYDNGVGTLLEVFESDSEIGLFVARGEDCISLRLPPEEAWNLALALTEWSNSD